MILADLINEIIKTITDVIVENPHEKLLIIILRLLYGIIMSFIVFLSSKSKEFEPLIKFLRDLTEEIADYDNYALIPIDRKYKPDLVETEKEMVHRKGHWVEKCCFRRPVKRNQKEDV